jgi:hypothetical protein
MPDGPVSWDSWTKCVNGYRVGAISCSANSAPRNVRVGSRPAYRGLSVAGPLYGLERPKRRRTSGLAGFSLLAIILIPFGAGKFPRIRLSGWQARFWQRCALALGRPDRAVCFWYERGTITQQQRCAGSEGGCNGPADRSGGL